MSASGDVETPPLAGAGVAVPLVTSRPMQKAGHDAAPDWTSHPPLRAGRRWVAGHPRAVDGAIAVGLFVVGLNVEPDGAAIAPRLDAMVVALLAVSCGALVLRRAYPLAVWAGTLAVGMIAVARADPLPVVAVPAMVALFTIAMQRPLRVTLLATAGTVAVYGAVATDLEGAGITVGWSATAAAIGVAIRSQRAALGAARERAAQAEATREEEAQRRVTDERLRIAHELHDVVAHHISVINVQAGVARHLLDTRPEAARDALGYVRDASQTVLTEMSTLLGLLRHDEDAAPTQPAPGLAHLPGLVESAFRAGLDVSVEVLGQPADLAVAIDLAAYRVIQESLTNALKHGQGEAALTVDYRPSGIVIDVVNRADVTPATRPDGTGHGLVGMRERVAAVGGRLHAGGGSDARFKVHAELPARLV